MTTPSSHVFDAPRPRRRRRRERRRRRRARRLLATIVAAALLVLVGLAMLLISGLDRKPVQRHAGAHDEELVRVVEGGTPDGEPRRIVYAYSVVPGGAYTPEEFASAIERDAVVAAHYEDVEVRGLRLETVSEDRLVYVSYRMNDAVYWTGRQVRLQRGETVLTDGETTIRTRCGNRISDQPAAPVLENAPDPADLDRPAATLEPQAIPVVAEPLLPTALVTELALVPALSLSTPPELVPVPLEFTRRGPLPISVPPVDQRGPEMPVDPGRPVTPVPEPSTLLLVGVGSAAAMLQRLRAGRRHRRASSGGDPAYPERL